MSDHDDHKRAGRIIPAYAGSTSRRRRARGQAPDHPRIRGEHLHFLTSIPSKSGSSPHTRGAPRHREKSEDMSRIIPAYAGSTVRAASGVCPSSDHPRIRGEHPAGPLPAGQAAGSSPHTRGARSARSRPSLGPGIIPAYAGSTKKPNPSQPARGDHPRIRGEHGGPADGLHAGPGSSPHTRGARLIVPAAYTGLRIIPAYAGSTPTWTG